MSEILPVVTGSFRCAAEPELKFSPNGVAYCSVRVVADQQKKDDSGTWVDDKIIWARVTGFKKMAENMAESLTKGTLITVKGRISANEYEVKSGDAAGQMRTSIEIAADEIGVSLQWDAAHVIKADKLQGAQRASGSSQPPADNPWSTQPTADSPPPF